MDRVLDLSVPKDAREYCSTFHELLGQKEPAGFVKTNEGRVIHFATMSDQEAVEVANMLYDIQLQGEHGRAKRTGYQS